MLKQLEEIVSTSAKIMFKYSSSESSVTNETLEKININRTEKKSNKS
jgi:hypothetical protein